MDSNMSTVRKILLPSLLILAAGSFAADEAFHEGKWDTTVRLEVNGGMLPLHFTTSKCLTPEDKVPNAIQPGQQCRIFNRKESDGEVSWEIDCVDPKGKLHGVGKIQYQGDKFEGRMDMSIIDKEGKALPTMIYRMTGHRVGACPAEGLTTD